VKGAKGNLYLVVSNGESRATPSPPWVQASRRLWEQDKVQK